MVFSSTVFLFLFLPALLALYHAPAVFSLCKRHPLPPQCRTNENGGIAWKNTILLLASLFFYAWGEPWFVFVMVAEVFVTWLAAIRMDDSNGRRRVFWLVVTLAVNLGTLFGFKYFAFFHRNILALAGVDFRPIKIPLPVGISFFTFQILSYSIDLFRGRVCVQRKFADLLLYVALFPQLIAGPIVRYADIENEIRRRQESFSMFSCGVCRFIIGLGKKVLLANYLAVAADNLFLMSETGLQLSAATAWIGLVAYTLQIYFDFSGYSDMAIGLGLMFGFRFGENFAHPYVATSVTDFWRRWHISLSSWFRDYVYIPLGGNRRSRLRVIVNLLVVWLLTGFWHGANWTFVAWGLLYFLALLLERVLGLAKKKNPLLRIWTLLVVMIAWALFRSSTLSDAARFIGFLFGSSGVLADRTSLVYLRNMGAVLPVACIVAFPVRARLERWFQAGSPSRRATGDILFSAGAVTILLASILACFKSSYNPFIYFNF